MLKSILSLGIIVCKNFLQSKLKYRTKPKVLQLPITSKCNSRCVICNIWKNKTFIDIDSQDLQKVLQDSYFKKIETVGLNGGEPTLHKNFNDVIDAVLQLPKLKSIHLISNSLITNKILTVLKYGKMRCSLKGVRFGFTISIDGVNEIHNFVRGIPSAFEKTMKSLDEIIKNKNEYYDYIEIGCTISKYNVYYLAEMDSYFSNYSIPVCYHLAVPNKRIGTFDDANYSVLSDNRAKLMAEEFFLTKYMMDSKSIIDKIRYFMNYYYLKNEGKGRLAICNYLYQDITIDESLNVYLCATASDCIGNLKNNNFKSFIKNGQVKSIRKKNSQECNTCIHYVNYPAFNGLVILIKQYLNKKITWNIRFKYLR
jgi:MoaA/NifB/PqqE/SkfB family radical SAM enzyme